MKLAALSVDLDEVPCYTAIHGLTPPTGNAAHAIYDRAVARFERFFEEERIPATFFVIGRDAERRENAEALRRLSARGHELGNHSLSHYYDLTRRPRNEIRDEIDSGARAIAEATGVRPVGFRAPGYTITHTVFEVLRGLGYTYDSSVFPCPTYYGAKATAITTLRARGRRSRSILDDPRVLLAPADPYRVGTPYWTRGQGLLELPIGVTRDLSGRLPFIGTSVTLAGERAAAALTRLAVGRPLINLELHGIDLADADEDGLSFLRPHQPDLRKSARVKRAALRTAVSTLRHAGYEFVTLAQATRAVPGS